MTEEKTRLYLTRHGEVINHGVYNGQTDVDITPDLGVRQMERLRELLRDKSLTAGWYPATFCGREKGPRSSARPTVSIRRGLPNSGR